LRFSHQAKVQVVISEDLGKQTSAGIRGQHSIGEALKELLKATGLNYRVVSDTSITIGKVGNATPSTSGENEPPAKRQDQSSSGDRHPSAQTGQGQNQSSVSVDQDKNDSSRQNEKNQKVQLEELMVTGTRIRGTSPASPLIEIGKKDIDDSGYSTVGDVIRSLPESFSGGINPGVVGAQGGTANSQNISEASTVNLRGLGPNSTLTLIDGHRLAYNGFASSVDISSIPIAGDRPHRNTDRRSLIDLWV